MIYLAAPWFKPHEAETYKKVLNKLRESGEEVWAPIECIIDKENQLPNEEWARQIFAEDVKALDQCDRVVVINFGMYSDTGTAWETGYAYAKGKPILMLVDDEYEATYSLMMCNGCTTLNNIANFLEDTNNFLCVEQK